MHRVKTSPPLQLYDAVKLGHASTLDPPPCHACSRSPSCRRRRCTQPGDQRQDFGEHPAGHCDLGRPECYVSPMADNGFPSLLYLVPVRWMLSTIKDV